MTLCTENQPRLSLARRHDSCAPFENRRPAGETNQHRCIWRLTILAACLFMLSTSPAFAGSDDGQADSAPLPEDLTDMSLEQLMDIEITSVSKRPQKISEAAAAVFVVTREDIRQWGVTNIPDALRMVPGLQVGRIDSNKWAVTSRGFNSRFANKLLVLIDGRSVYTPLFAGVYWETQNTPMEDIDRIEVIRGPGGTLWGANAVNGVINIITRSASQTKGGLVSAIAGSEQNELLVRYGGQLDNGADYRVYGEFFSRDEGYASGGAHDDWRLGQGGFRSDWERSSTDTFTFQGDYYDGKLGQQVTTAGNPPPTLLTSNNDVDVSGGNALLRWQHVLNNGSDFALQLYYDYVSREGEVLYEDRDTVDIDFQHHLKFRDVHDVVWGLGYRYTYDDTKSNPNFALDPESRDVDLFSAFLQDEITLVEDELFLTVGSKFEHNDFSGTEVQPNVRLAWTPDTRQTVWGAISRAVRTPARGEANVQLRVPPPTSPALPTPAQCAMGVPDPRCAPLVLQGSNNFNSEILIAYELGYRIKATRTLSVDTALFFNDYDDLRTFDPKVFPPPIVGFPFDNNMEGESYGAEVTAQWQVMPDWRLQGSYTYLNVSLDLKNGSMDTVSESAEDADPKHRASIWSTYDLGSKWELGSGLRYVSSIDAPGAGADSYVQLDLRIGWLPSNNLELSLVGRNLLDKRQPEFQPDFILTQPTQIERSFFANAKWRF